MKIILAPDSFKGSLSAQKVCDIGEKACLDLFPQGEIVKLPMADGGEGTVESILDAFDGEEIQITVKNPIGTPISCSFGMFQGENAILEMAAASGITLVDDKDRTMLHSNTYGTGQLLVEAMNRGAKTIYIGIGGSATNDGGIGCLSAMGLTFLDENGADLEPYPVNFNKIVDIDLSKLHPKVKETKIVIMSDVKNPLLGKEGATYVYGPQKGAKKEDLPLLEEGMAHFFQVVEKKINRNVVDVEGAGAAGGLGAGLLAFTSGEICSGVETILEILDMKTHLKDCQLVITGEGKMDNQSAFGKVVYGVGTACAEKNIPCVAVVGGLGQDYEEMYRHGISSIMTTTDRIMTLEEAVTDAETLCYAAFYRLLKLLQIGTTLS